MAGTGERTRPSGESTVSLYPVGFRHHWFERQLLWCCSGRSLWKNGRLAALSLPRHATARFFSSFYTHAPAARRSRTAGALNDWVSRAGKRTSPTLSADALRPLMTKQRKQRWTWLNSSRISCSCWRSLTSLIDVEADLCVKLHDDAKTSFSITLSSRLDALQDGNWWPECLLVRLPDWRVE